MHCVYEEDMFGYTTTSKRWEAYRQRVVLNRKADNSYFSLLWISSRRVYELILFHPSGELRGSSYSSLPPHAPSTCSWAGYSLVICRWTELLMIASLAATYTMSQHLLRITRLLFNVLMLNLSPEILCH